MNFHHDRENPFEKILVKKDSDTVGFIMRNLITGHYHFYRENAVESSLRESRIDTIKAKIEVMLCNNEVRN